MTAEQLLRLARCRIADALREPDDVPRALGTITLHEEQWLAARRAASIVRLHRGVLVANDVGSGKTYVALAVARSLGRLLVIAPAALKPAWERSLSNVGMAGVVLGLESLSRYVDPYAIATADVVIVDESHHLRNRATKRYAAVATICARSRVILLSATPLQNRLADIAAQLALFVGDRAFSLSDEHLAELIVRRRNATHDAHLPDTDGPHRVKLECDDDLLDELLALPPPLPPSDGGDGGALVSYTLVRRWASSQAALVATLERRLAAALAIESALETGRLPTRAELAAWSVADSAMQLAFPELMVTSSREPSAAALLAVVRRHADAVRRLLRRIRARRDPDAIRAAALRAIASAHRGEVVIAFSEYAETVRALGRLLATDGGAAWLTSHGGHTATGRLSRREILAQLAPDSVIPPAERIAMLLTTDVLSEGLDLQRASVVVHLDLPWNPARLEQRVGRIRRLGSPHGRVSVYALAPPASADRLVRVEQRLQEKLRLAERSVGVAGRILPPTFALDVEPIAPSVAESRSDLLSVVRTWQLSPPATTSEWTSLDPPIAAAVAEFDGFLAALSDGDRTLLVADTGAGPTTDDRVVLRAARAAAGASIGAPISLVEDATRALGEWWKVRRGSAALDLRVGTTGDVRARALERLASIASRSPRHERIRITSQVNVARSAVVATLSAGSERVLGALVASALPDEAWLRALAAFAEAHGPPPRVEGETRAAPPLVAMILLVKGCQLRPEPVSLVAESPSPPDGGGIHVDRVQGVPAQAEHPGAGIGRRHR